MSGGKEMNPFIETLMEVNLDFYFYNDNVFHLGRSGMLPLFKILSEENNHNNSQIKGSGNVNS